MKKLAVCFMTLISFAAQPIQADPHEDILIGLVAGTVPVLGQAWILSSLRRMQADKSKAATATVSSLVGTYIWLVAGGHIADNYPSLGKIGYLIPSIPALLAAAVLDAFSAK